MPDPSTAPDSAGFRPDAVFILGMLHRTGTNHLADLFGLHDGVEVLAPIFEDQLVRHSPLLVAYVDAVTRNWTPEWNVPATEGPALLRSIGDGIVASLAQLEVGTSRIQRSAWAGSRGGNGMT